MVTKDIIQSNNKTSQIIAFLKPIEIFLTSEYIED